MASHSLNNPNDATKRVDMPSEQPTISAPACRSCGGRGGPGGDSIFETSASCSQDVVDHLAALFDVGQLAAAETPP